MCFAPNSLGRLYRQQQLQFMFGSGERTQRVVGDPQVESRLKLIGVGGQNSFISDHCILVQFQRHRRSAKKVVGGNIAGIRHHRLPQQVVGLFRLTCIEQAVALGNS